MTIEILHIEVDTWIDGSSREEGNKYIPSVMLVEAQINGIKVSNIMLPYIAVTDTERIKNNIKETLYLKP